MLHIHKLCLWGAALLFAWLALLLNTTEQPARTLVLVSPLLALVVFGAYLAAALLYGVLTFRTVPAEAALLNKDIARAKADLAKRGVKY